ncbi:MAG: hypothetical protein ACOC2H_05585 [Spirochaetota bacterium]
MKQIFVILITATLFLSCATTNTPKEDPETVPQTTVAPETIDDTGVPSGDSLETIYRKYRKEGFIDPDTYSIVIVRPSDSNDSEDEIISQAKKRAYVSFQKHIRQQGKIVDQNMNAALLNLVNSRGNLQRIEDSEDSRTVYVFLIKRERLKHYIETL